jgi:hypothetical protein
MNDQKTPKIIYSVILANSTKMNHTYDVPQNYQEMQTFAKFMADMITIAMSRGERGVLFFQNPSIIYNPNYVIGVMYETFGAEELQDLMSKAQKERVGFIKDQK